ncbi:hypothetical protein ERJ75_000717600 [Trypanosoma vivax]|uniref:Uncharacterized protein n=1 Tax=Trypanosoma vivax (strain Y486) TaxID=1055687 RepID=G0TWQ1_TRYVY|nr:hypothetical protein ERJ75_000717600 [Trypanosoma vivax]CCC48389.1 conserved hypothetical protein [Trypanosoma vivax Y486]
MATVATLPWNTLQPVGCNQNPGTKDTNGCCSSRFIDGFARLIDSIQQQEGTNNVLLVPIVHALREKLSECQHMLDQIDSERRAMHEELACVRKAFFENMLAQDQLHTGIRDVLKNFRFSRPGVTVTSQENDEAEPMRCARGSAPGENVDMLCSCRCGAGSINAPATRMFSDGHDRGKVYEAKYKSRFSAAKDLLRRQCESIEVMRMTLEDSCTVNVDSLLLPMDDLIVSAFQGTVLPGKQTSLLSWDSVTVHEPTSSALPEDSFPKLLREFICRLVEGNAGVKELFQSSALSGPLLQLVNTLLQFSADLCEAHKLGLRSAYDMIQHTFYNKIDVLMDPIVGISGALVGAIEKLSLFDRTLIHGLSESLRIFLVQVSGIEGCLLNEAQAAKKDKRCDDCSLTVGKLSVEHAKVQRCTFPNTPRPVPEQHTRPFFCGCQCNLSTEGALQKALFVLDKLVVLHRAFLDLAGTARMPDTSSRARLRDAFEEFGVVATIPALEDPRFESMVAEAVRIDVDEIKSILAKLTCTPNRALSSNRNQSLQVNLLDAHSGSQQVSRLPDTPRDNITDRQQPISVVGLGTVLLTPNGASTSRANGRKMDELGRQVRHASVTGARNVVSPSALPMDPPAFCGPVKGSCTHKSLGLPLVALSSPASRKPPQGAFVRKAAFQQSHRAIPPNGRRAGSLRARFDALTRNNISLHEERRQVEGSKGKKNAL